MLAIAPSDARADGSSAARAVASPLNVARKNAVA
jgi:hypothetical protein